MNEMSFHGASIFNHLLVRQHPVDNFGTVVGANPTPYGILALWAVNGLSIVYWATPYAGNAKKISENYGLYVYSLLE